MAASSATSKNNMRNSDDYLSDFNKLSPQIYFYHPVLNKSTDGSSGAASPVVPVSDLIIICSWMAAEPRHIAKYTKAYLSRYQQIPILLLRSSLADVMMKPEQDQLEDIKPAVTAIQGVFASLETSPRVLLHLFSNGGSWSSTILADGYQQATGGLTLPVSAIVMDSCPSSPHIAMSHLALMAALPKLFIIRFIGSILLWIVLYIIRAVNKLGLSENVILKIRRRLNDPMSPFMKGGVPRVYIASKTDKMVPLSDVEEHAEEAKAVMRHAGFTDDEVQKRVEFEEFQGSAHVGHLMIDADRYWSVIRKLWTVATHLREQAEIDLKNLRERKSKANT